ncbi:nucleotide disphospho-sugar-binding domain-containing protein [Pseudonocardia sp.]|uniref:glycosyltransferase n=1 Tax=Pseudonocardia sp. TaxID=60912 RepID=UPI00260CB878|nr:nucleotide disphospho-sugar-binding domain-containing protein [Pseudonocardia sp.]
MAGILIVTWDGGGNVPPALGIGAELSGRGHRVRVLGHPQQRTAVTTAGLDFAAYTHAPPWNAVGATSGARYAAAYLGLFSDPRPGADVRAELGREPADLVLADAMSLGALKGAQRAGAPTAVLAHTFHRYLTHGWARGPIGALATLRGLRPGRLWGAAQRVLVASDRALDPVDADRLPANVRHTGPVQPAPRPVSRDAEPLVLVSLSTIHYPAQAQALQAALDSLDGLDVRAVASTGAVEPAVLRVPPGVELHRRIDHGELMPRASLLIGHGGHATTMRALAHDLPLLALPLSPVVDQPMVGRAVADAGAGRTLPASATAEQVRDAVRTLLAAGPHRAAAAAVGARIRSTDGAVRAADEIEAVLARTGAGRASDAP